ncbi:MAG: hypothetical protein WCF88_02035 [Candidatus Acidiferrales bacterium]|jgi:hypothetical protein
MAKKKPARKKKSAKKPARPKKKEILKKKLASAKRVTKKKPARRKKQSAPRTPAEVSNPIVSPNRRGLGPGAGGQSGDNQGLSRKESADSESVEELTEEGQEYEAEVISGVENARDPDQGEVTTKEVPEDDVPSEYDKQDQ